MISNPERFGPFSRRPGSGRMLRIALAGSVLAIVAGRALLAPAASESAPASDAWFIPAVAEGEARQAGAAVPQLRTHRQPANWRRERLPGPYPVTVLRVIDGDTLEARIRVWLGQDVVTRIRLRNIDAPELRARCPAEARLAREARLNLKQLLAAGPVEVTDIGPGKYAGRVIAAVRVRNGSGHQARTTDAGKMLLAGGYARPYQRGKRGSWCDLAGGP